MVSLFLFYFLKKRDLACAFQEEREVMNIINDRINYSNQFHWIKLVLIPIIDLEFLN